MDYLEFAVGVVIGLFMMGGVYALLYLALNACIRAYEDIHK